MALNKQILTALLSTILTCFGIIFANYSQAKGACDNTELLINQWSNHPELFQTWMNDGAYHVQDSTVVKAPKKVAAVLLAIALGPFGVHRLYLGTVAKVPVIYTLTLGGGLGILPLLDIIAILSNPNLEKFTQNEKVVMWAN